MMIDTKLARTWFLFLVCVAALGAVGRPARADRARIVVVGGGGGEAEEVAAAAAAALREAGWQGEVVTAPDPALVEALRACSGNQAPESCQQAARAAGGRLLAIELAGEPAVISLTGWLFGEEGEQPLAERRFCDPCTAGALERSAGDLVRFLVRESAGAATRSVIRIRTRPPGARVMVDGKAVGVSDLDYTVYPGRHQIRLDRAGFRVEAREVSAPAGATIDLAVDLERGDSAGGGGRGALPWLVGGAGVAAVAGGVALIALDSPRTDDEGRQNADYRSSLWPGIGLAAAGAGLVGAGIWLWLRRAPSTGAGAAPAVAVDASSGGLWVGGVGRF